MHNNIKIKLLNSEEIRYLITEQETLILGIDLCKAINLTTYYLSKTYKDENKRKMVFKKPLRNKSGATPDMYVANRNGVIYLCGLAENPGDFLKWADAEIFNSEPNEQSEQNTINDLNFSTNHQNGTLNVEKIKLLNNITDILNKGNISNNAKLNILLTLLDDLGLDINKEWTI